MARLSPAHAALRNAFNAAHLCARRVHLEHRKEQGHLTGCSTQERLDRLIAKVLRTRCNESCLVVVLRLLRLSLLPG